MPPKCMLVCPNCGKPTRVAHKVLAGWHRRTRACKKCRRELSKVRRKRHGKTERTCYQSEVAPAAPEEVRLQECHADPEA